MKEWNSPSGLLKLERFPFPGGKSHLAWDAADEWILNRFPELSEPAVITGEAFGVLSAAWGRADITAVSDSFLSFQAADKNLDLNTLAATGSLTKIPVNRDVKKTEAANLVFIRLPKDLELFEIYLEASLGLAADDADFWIGGMDRRWSSGVEKITAKYLTPEEVFPFTRHARWIRFKSTPGTASALTAPIAPAAGQNIRRLEEYPILINRSKAVFSADKTDGGTAAFLEAFPENAAAEASMIADLGCGAGTLGLVAAHINKNAKIIFSDESFLAVKAALENAELNGISGRSEFLASNGLIGVKDGSVDLVLCNPPFHFQNIQTLEPAEFMFSEARRVLRPGGTIQIVGNSHLGYHRHLKNFFPDSRTVLKNSRFTVIRGRR